MLQLKLKDDKRLVADTAVFLSRIARSFGVSAKRENMLCFALETVLEKRMDQLNENNPYVLVEMQESASGLKISITDKGVPYVLTENQKKLLRNGLADLFTMDQLGADGQRLTLCFRQSGDIAGKLSKEKITLLDTEAACELTGTRDEDIIEAIRCIYSVYGYNYVHPQLYHIDHFRERLNSGKYISVLCKNAHGQSLGHVALDEQDELPGMMEFCNLVVKPSARGLGVAGKLTAAVFEAGKTCKTGGIFSKPVMQHTATQKILDHSGFVPCGMNFNAMGTDIIADKEFSGRDARLHWAFSIAAFDTETEHVLYLPDECKPFILDVFDRTQMNYRVMEAGQVTSPQSEISYHVNNAARTIDIIINRVGADFENRMDTFRNEKETDLIESILVQLNMNDPACPACYRYFRDNGYIFTGCLPGSTAGDYLLLEDLRGKPIEKSTIVAEPNYEKMLNTLYNMMQ